MAILDRKQAGVAAGMAAGVALTVTAFLWPSLPEVPADIPDRLALWLACVAFVGLWPMLAVARLAGHRFFTPQDIDGGGSNDGTPRARQLQAVLQNTLEQALLAFVASGAWLWLAPEARRGLAIVFAVYFAVGRLLFFIGYSRSAPARALGFALSFYPTVGLLLALLPAMISRMFG